MNNLSRSESLLAVGALLLLGLALGLPAIQQDPAYHQFADTRVFGGLSRALDVLSNIGFLVLGLYGLVLQCSGRLQFFGAALRLSTLVFFSGFVLTALGSSYYHAAPDDAGLVVDRLGMVVVFAGVLGMAAAHRISERAGFATLNLGLAAGVGSVLWWAAAGNLMPYAIVQFGGIALALAMMLSPARGLGPRWTGLLLTYALAKVFETFDAQVFTLTAHLVSGHTIKHLLAALPVLAVTSALRKR